MFLNNSGAKLKIVARVMFWTIFISSSIFFIVCANDFLDVPVAILFVPPITFVIAWIFSIPIFLLAELCQNVEASKNYLEDISKIVGNKSTDNENVDNNFSPTPPLPKNSCPECEESINVNATECPYFCPECGRAISITSPVCPFCNYVIK